MLKQKTVIMLIYQKVRAYLNQNIHTIFVVETSSIRADQISFTVVYHEEKRQIIIKNCT